MPTNRRLALAGAGAILAIALVARLALRVSQAVHPEIAEAAASAGDTDRRERGRSGSEPEPVASLALQAAAERFALDAGAAAHSGEGTASELHGTVVRVPCGTPAPGISVHVYPRSSSSEPESDRLAAIENRSVRHARSDGRGRFVIQDLAAGRYAAVAFTAVGRSGVREFALTPERVTEIALQLPIAATLEGSVLAAPGVLLDDIRMRVTLLETGRSFEANVDASGRFRFDDLPVGPANVELGSEGWADPGQGFESLAILPGTWIDLGTVELVPGPNTHDFDLARGVPGYLLVRVRQRGVPVAGLTLDVEPLAQGASRGLNGSWRFRDGTYQIGPLAPGPWRISLQSRSGGWRLRSVGIAQVQRTGPTVFEADLWIARGTLRLLDAKSGAPLADSTVMVRSPDEGYGKAYRTDADGSIELELPLGAFDAARGGSAPPRWGSARAFTWTMGGAVPDALRLEPPSKGP